MRHARRSPSGFTLLEVMVAMTILAGALLGLTLGVSRSVAASAHARFMTQATFLCRQQLVQLEDKFILDGFGDDAMTKEEKGEFEEPAFKRFRWVRVTEKIRLPAVDQMQSAASKALQDKQQIGAGAGNVQAGLAGGAPAGGPGGAGGGGPGAAGMIGGMLGPVKEMLEQGIRRVTVRVIWDEPGRPDQMVEVVAFYTDMRRIPIP